MELSQSAYWDALFAAIEADGIVPFRRAIHRVLDAIGFGALYFLAPVVADRRVGRVLWNVGFPRDWERSYEQEGRWVDPLPDIALSHNEPFRWSEAGQIASLSREARAFLADLDQRSMSDGIGVLCTCPRSRNGFVGIGKPLSREPVSEAQLHMGGVAAQACFQRYCALVSSDAQEIPELSAREIEVLRWIAAGKSNSAIATILDISKSSVDSYVKRIFAKLGVCDRTTAAVKAVAIGLIAPGRHSKNAAHRPRWDG